MDSVGGKNFSPNTGSPAFVSGKSYNSIELGGEVLNGGEYSFGRTDDFSFSCWMKITTTDRNCGVLQVSSYNGSHGIHVDGGTIRSGTRSDSTELNRIVHGTQILNE